jgi:hypothetical protein
MLLMQAGRRLRTRHPEDLVDPSTFPLAKQLMCVDAMRVSDSRQIKHLEAVGVIERTPDPADGRASLVRLSGQGRATMQAAFQRRFKRIQEVLEPWNAKDRAHLQDLLTRLAADLASANDRDTSDFLQTTGTPA